MNDNDRGDLTLAHTLGRLEGAMQGMKDAITTLTTSMKDNHDALATRVSKLEEWRVKIVAAGALAGALGAKAGSFLSTVL